MPKGITGYKKKLGARGEKVAAEYLQEVGGYKIIERNYTCPLGEIDLVACDQKTIVFVEVRSGTLFFAGWAEESIGFRKQKKLRQLALYYLKEKGWSREKICLNYLCPVAGAVRQNHTSFAPAAAMA